MEYTTIILPHLLQLLHQLHLLHRNNTTNLHIHHSAQNTSIIDLIIITTLRPVQAKNTSTIIIIITTTITADTAVRTDMVHPKNIITEATEDIQEDMGEAAGMEEMAATVATVVRIYTIRKFHKKNNRSQTMQTRNQHKKVVNLDNE